MRLSELAPLLRPTRPTGSRTARRLARCYSVEDLRSVARRRLPTSVFDYLEGGAEDEVTLRRDRTAFDRIELLPRVLRDVAEVDLTVELLGRTLPLPLVLAPTGFSRMFHPEGERAVARAAARANLTYALSTLSTVSIEEVARVGAGPRWFQLYVWRDRGLAKDLLTRAREAGYEALVLTVDVPVSGARERDLRNGLTIPPQLTARTVLDGLLHPAWSARFVRGEAVSFANLDGDTSTASSPDLRRFRQLFDPSVTWADLDWMAGAWGGPIVVKGVMTAADARLAAQAGARAVVVSNHGGRQLDGAPAPIDVLPAVVDAVGDAVDVLLDGGIRRGGDVVKAIALGARAVLIGRAYLYGLAAGGDDGVTRAVTLLEQEMRRTMQLLGVTGVGGLTRDAVRGGAADRRDPSEA